jgi:ABC-2 type transport system permease protein/lipopolysaccharide transport system permease protein
MNTPLLNKVYCPREVFPLGAITVAAVDALIATGVLFLLFAITGYAPRSGIVYAPLLLLVLLAFTIGVTLVVSAIVVYMRDLRLVLPIVLQIGIFITPVAYNAAVVTTSTAGFSLYSALNPLASVIDGLRRGILYGQAPQWWPLLAAAGSSLIVVVGGYVFFKRLETGMADVA